jgi:hypothetical protein
MCRMLKQGESFWTTVYPLFMSRDLSRTDLRRVIRVGLDITNGNYGTLVGLFNMPAADDKRFLGFLRKYDCHLIVLTPPAAPVTRGRQEVDLHACR